jgi:hypothetical protein
MRGRGLLQRDAIAAVACRKRRAAKGKEGEKSLEERL